MTMVLRTSLGTLAICLAMGLARNASAGPCVPDQNGLAAQINPTLVCRPPEPKLPGMSITAAMPSDPLQARPISLPSARRFTLMLLATTARMSNHTIAYTIQSEPIAYDPIRTVSASVAASSGMMDLLHAPRQLGLAFMLDLGLIGPDQAARATNPFVGTDIGGVTTLIRPRESSWSRPNHNTMFSDLFGENDVTEGKDATRTE